MKKKLYIANDIECAGSMVGVHSMLSWGACVVTHEQLTHKERIARGLTCYIEFKPLSREFDISAMRVGCSGLHCLKDVWQVPEYDVTSRSFAPEKVLDILSAKGLSVHAGIAQFLLWLEDMKARTRATDIIAVTDTVFFDSCFIQHLFGTARARSPYGHSGIDLDSLYRGYIQDMAVSIRELKVPDTREKSSLRAR